SVGYRVHRYEIEKRDGQPELWRAVDWEPIEISAVPIGADPGAHVRAGDAAPMPCVLVRRDDPAAPPAAQPQRSEMPEQQTPVAGDPSDTNPAPETRATAPAAPVATPGAPQPAQPGADQVRREERERIAAIRMLGDRFELDRP